MGGTGREANCASGLGGLWEILQEEEEEEGPESEVEIRKTPELRGGRAVTSSEVTHT